MKIKATMLIMILLAILTIGAVSAADGNETSEALAVEDNIELNASDLEVMANDESDFLVGDPIVVVPGTFADLQDEIDASSDKLVLMKDYNGDGNSISITKSFSINGAGHTLDAQGGRVFEIMADNVIISNLVIVNAYVNGSSGAAIHMEGNGCSIINCSIYGSNSGRDGGAIYVNGNNTLIDNVEVINASSSRTGGAIYLNGLMNKIINSYFECCNATSGGAIYVRGENNTIFSSTFNRNNVTGKGGAISVDGNNFSVINSKFYNTSAESSPSNYTSDNSGGALYIEGNYAIISGSSFDSSYAYAGGAIYLAGSYCNVTNVISTNSYSATDGGAILFAGSYTNVYYSNFKNAVAENNGGSIYWDSGYGYHVIVGCIFENNTAHGNVTFDGRGGGAVCCLSGSNIVIRDSKFTNNSAVTTEKADGGAILLYYNEGCIIDNCTFDGNYVTSTGSTNHDWVQGGAILLKSKNVTLSNCVFMNCWSQKEGGAAYLSNNYNTPVGPIDFRVINVTFINNTAKGEDVEQALICGGGAVLLKEHNYVLFDNVTFINNTANQGGALSVTNERGNANSFYNCKFIGNEAANDGGSIWSTSTLRITNFTISDGKAGNFGGGIYSASDIMYDNLTFTNNTANRGGGLFWNKNSARIENMTFINNNAEYGGAIYIPSSSQQVSHNVFNANQANSGGAIYVQGSSVTIQYNNFTSSSAYDGGAIYLDGTSGNVLNNNFEDNMVNSNGGAIYCNGMNARIYYNNFTNNVAQLEGGAISLANRGEVKNNTFIENIADNGGAIYVSGANSQIKDSDFMRNLALSGGAVYAESSLSISNSTFIENQANANGGAVYSSDDHLVTVSGSNFTDNVASHGGAMYNCNYDDCTVVGNGSQIYPLNIAPDIEITVNDIFVGETAVVNVVLPSDAEGDVKIIVDGIMKVVSLAGGSGSANFSNLGAGTYDVSVTFDGDGNYLNNTNAKSFEVSKRPTDLTVYINNIHVGETAVVNVVLPSDATGDIEVDVDGKVISASIVDGKATVNVSGLALGTYFASVSYDGDDKYLGTMVVKSFSVTKANPDVNISADNTQPNESQMITVQLPGDASGNVTFCLYKGDKVIQNVTYKVSEGSASLSVSNLDIGSYNLTIRYSGDGKYSATSDYTLFTVSPKTTVTPQVYKGDNIEITVDFGDINGTSITGNVRVYIDGEEYASQKISGSRLNYLISTEGIVLGNHEVTFQYAGTSFAEDIFRYWDSKTQQYMPIRHDVLVSPKDIVIPPTLDTDDTGDVVVEMPVDSEGILEISLDSGQKIATVNLSNYANRTDLFKETIQSVLNDCQVMIEKTEEGRLLITMTFTQTKGDVGVVLVYSGDGKYAPFVKVSKASVRHKNPVISAGNLNMLYSSGKMYSVVVYGNNGKVAGGVQVTFLINNGVIGSAKTNAKGVASIKITQAPGSYKITAKALGTSVTKKLTVTHVLSLKTVKVKSSAKKLVLKATLKKVNGKYLKGKKVTFKFNGKKFKAKTNKKGVAKVTVKRSVLKKLKAGKKVKYQATYLKDTVKKSVKVKK